MDVDDNTQGDVKLEALHWTEKYDSKFIWPILRGYTLQAVQRWQEAPAASRRVLSAQYLKYVDYLSLLFGQN